MRTEHLDVRASDSLLSHSRVGIIVGKLGHTIVERNLLRRRLRELVRTRLLPEAKSIDVLVRANGSAYSASFSELKEEVEEIASRFRKSGNA